MGTALSLIWLMLGELLRLQFNTLLGVFSILIGQHSMIEGNEGDNGHEGDEGNEGSKGNEGHEAKRGMRVLREMRNEWQFIKAWPHLYDLALWGDALQMRVNEGNEAG